MNIPPFIIEALSHFAIHGEIPQHYNGVSLDMKTVIPMLAEALVLGEHRELIVAGLFDGTPITSKHGHDCMVIMKDGTRRYVEVKTESQITGKTPAAGKMSMGISSEELYNRLVDENPLMVVAGFTESNELMYMLSFDFTDPGFIEFWDDRGLTKQSSKHRLTYNTYRDFNSVMIHYVNHKISENRCTVPFYDWITDKQDETWIPKNNHRRFLVEKF